MSPLYFAVSRLHKMPYRWQAECLEAVGIQEDDGPPVSVVAANGSGKTSDLVAPLVLWFLDRYPRGQVVVTSGSFRQVEKQLWPSMRKYQANFPEWQFLQTEIKTPQGGFALGFSTDQPGRAEGWHPKVGQETDPVFIIVDEAKTVPNKIFEAFDRCTRVFQLWVSSPGAAAGEFYESFHANRKFFWTRHVTSMECPHIDPAKRERDREKHGENSALYRSMHLAEFTEDEERLVITASALREAVEHQPEPNRTGERVAFFDFAAGRDENVFYERSGNVVELVDAWVESDTVQAVRKFIRLANERGLAPGQCWGDADGLGKPMVDQFADAGFRINAFRGGMAAQDPENYANLISEVWIQGARKIERGKIHFVTDGAGAIDPLTFKQMTTRFIEWDGKGKLRIESKDKMAERGLRSPDRGDSAFGCIMCGSHMSGAITGDDVENSSTGDSQFATGHVSGF